MAIFTLTLTRKKDNNSISRDYDLTFPSLPEENLIELIGEKVFDMKKTIEESEDVKF